MALNSAGLTVLPAEECLALLEHEHVGRVVLSIDALPVNYRLIDGSIVFRTDSGGKLTPPSTVAFEIDYIDHAEHSGSSVLVVGPCRIITDADELA